eukprot:TRINITY_DN27088_c0_g1_i1.p1 TRINITY_DN27088_c0_g1~~TRINITY_DN27088_c0_g1_i1.p1  ORF type:complete len:430 (+),score=68.65 TRINITY_DN27088_c0_g1_i1:199-1488(+)
MHRSRRQGPTGIISHDVSDIVEPVRCDLRALQQEIDNERQTLMDELHQDPLPEIPCQEILSVTKVLEETTAVLQSAVHEFTAGALASMSDANMKALQEKARESASKILLLIADKSSSFHVEDVQGQLIANQGCWQDLRTKRGLRSLKSFFDTFGTSKWFGGQFQTDFFMKQMNVVGTLFEEPPEPQEGFVPLDTGIRSPPGCDSEYEETEKYDASSDDGSHDSPRSSCQSSRPLASASPASARVGRFGSSWLCSWLSGDASQALHPPTKALSRLAAVSKTFETLKDILEEDYLKRVEMETYLKAKTDAVIHFIVVLGDMQRILKKYILLRLGDLTLNEGDLATLKQWVTQEEATNAHRTLEAFRDEVNLARAVYRIQEQASAASEAWMPQIGGVEGLRFQKATMHGKTFSGQGGSVLNGERNAKKRRLK